MADSVRVNKMTVPRSEINIKTVLAAVSLAAILISVGVSWGNAQMMSIRFEEKLVDVKAVVVQHAQDTDKHMSFSDKVSTFVSRAEWDQIKEELRLQDLRQRAIMSSLARIEEQLEH